MTYSPLGYANMGEASSLELKCRQMQTLAQKKKQFDRLCASANDFRQANFCARYLLKKGWHSHPWERRGTIYAQQTAFVTNLIIAYARPFVLSKGWPAFPFKLTNFTVKQREMHERLVQMRHEIFAHSDSLHFNFWPLDMGNYRTIMEETPFAVLSAAETALIKVMTDNLIEFTSNKLNEVYKELTGRPYDGDD